MTPIGKVANSVVPKSFQAAINRDQKNMRLKKNIDMRNKQLKKTAPKQYQVLKTLAKNSVFYKVSSLKILY